MKLTSLLASCSALVGSAAAQGGYIYTIDQSVISSSTATINSETASSILARRRGLTEDRSIGTTDELILDTLKNYGGWQQPMFGQQQEEAPGKLFIRISGYDGAVTDLMNAMPDLWIEEPTTDLKTDFRANTNRKDGICEYVVPTGNSNKDIEVVFSYPAEEGIGCLSASEIPQLPIALAIRSVIPTTASSVPSTMQPLKRILLHLLATQGVESTVLLLPSKLAPTIPASTNKHMHARRAEETPFNMNAEDPSPAPVVEILASNNTDNTTHPLPKIVPACFKTLASCTNATNACSGHGQCYKSREECFKCRCGTTTVREYDDGSKKTVVWGGGACEKKDISVPFLLFAGFGIVMTSLVFGAIGMLYSMGSQKLPSVLSAGVAGPTARK